MAVQIPPPALRFWTATVPIAIVLSAGSAVPAAGMAVASAFVPCQSYDGMSILGSPGQMLAGQPGAGAVRVRNIGGRQPAQTLDAASVGLPVTAGGQFGHSVAAVKLNSDSCDDAVVGVPNAVGGVGRVVLVPGSGDALATDQAVVLDPGPAGIVAGDLLGWSVTAVPTDGGVLIAAGAPGHAVAGAAQAGAVVTWLIPSGGPGGTIPTPGLATLWVQGSGGVLGSANPGDRFGSVLAPAFPAAPGTLTVGIPDEDIGARADAGAVAQLHFIGATLTGSSMVWQGFGMPGKSRAGDRFGAAVAADSLGLSGIGIPGKDANGRRNSGAVIARRPSGGYKAVTQNTPGVPDKSERNDRFGSALGQLFGIRGIEYVTLAVGVPGEDKAGRSDVGAVTFIDIGETLTLRYGSQKAAGLPAKGRFGDSIAVVSGNFDFDEDRVDHLFVGAPGSSPASEGSYRRGLPTGVFPWESGMFFAP